MRPLVLLLCCLVISCVNFDTPEAPPLPTTPVVTIPHQPVYLNTINTLLHIPLHYKKVSPEAYYAIPDSLAGNPLYEAEVQERIAQLKNETRFTNDIFVDSSNYGNSIWVLHGKFLPHIPINKETAPTAVALIKQQAALEPDPMTFTQQQLGRTKTFAYIKLKAIQQYTDRQQYVTFYFISSSNKSFVVKVFNEEEEDFQTLINKTIFRPDGPT